jgi:hypothetical protein
MDTDASKIKGLLKDKEKEYVSVSWVVDNCNTTAKSFGVYLAVHNRDKNEKDKIRLARREKTDGKSVGYYDKSDLEKAGLLRIRKHTPCESNSKSENKSENKNSKNKNSTKSVKSLPLEKITSSHFTSDNHEYATKEWMQNEILTNYKHLLPYFAVLFGKNPPKLRGKKVSDENGKSVKIFDITSSVDKLYDMYANTELTGKAGTKKTLQEKNYKRNVIDFDGKKYVTIDWISKKSGQKIASLYTLLWAYNQKHSGCPVKAEKRAIIKTKEKVCTI